ncbi:unnamed protein product [Mesocestoides corti]|uniref:G_PROTEIN_RECEP_F2_4 domain-containing protein n=2 Tax=Mesocestoides corti TaxID=53468 RepID=A0A0R3UH35_MESCO|nr:unnamed protein product [Mesocestoides corti]
MLAIAIHVTLLLAHHVCGEATDSGLIPNDVIRSGEFGLFRARQNATRARAENLQPDSSIQCIGTMRGVLLTAGMHLEPLFEVIGRCPLGTDFNLADHCSNDIPEYPPGEASVEELQNQLLDELQSEGKPNLGPLLKHVIRKVSPVVDTDTGIIYANKYCAQCNINITENRLIQLPKQMVCDQENNTTKCFVHTDLSKNARMCSAPRPSLLFYFSWDSIFNLPDDEEPNEGAVEQSYIDSLFEALQWACCVFSLVTLVVAICVFSASARLRRPLPGKMMIALCCALLGALVAFLLGSGVMDNLTPFRSDLRPMCVTFAWFLQIFLLNAFVWMALFAVELFRTFGLARMFQQACICSRCRRNCDAEERSKNATSMMLRARRSDSNPTKRFKQQVALAFVIPLCFAIPTLVINECVYSRLLPLYNASLNNSWSNISQENELGRALHSLNPGFCPVHDPRRAWFTGHQIAFVVWFLGPAGSTICFNLFALLIVCIQICRLKRETQLSSNSAISKCKKQSKSLIAVCAKLSIILGASWFLQLFAGLWPQLDMLRRVAGLVNCSQGGIIAVSMLASTKARRVIAQWLPSRCRDAFGVRDSSSQTIQETTNSSRSNRRNVDYKNSQTASLIRSVSS